MHVVVVSICHQHVELWSGTKSILGTSTESGKPKRLAESAKSSKGPTISYDPASEHT
jgi:hypothetical protein